MPKNKSQVKKNKGGMRKRWQSGWIKLMAISLIQVSGTKMAQAAWQTQNLYLFNNQVEYGDWAVKEATAGAWYYEISKSDGKTYRFDREFSHADFSSGVWNSQGSFYCASSRQLGPGFYGHFPSGRTRTGIMRHPLEPEEWDFAYLGFKYKVGSNNLSNQTNYPALRVSICGSSDVLVLEKNDPRRTNKTDLNDMLTAVGEVQLPNPGTCDENNSELKIETVSLWTDDPSDWKIWDLNFRGRGAKETDVITIVGSPGVKVALVADETVIEEGERVRLAVNDWTKMNLQVGTVVAGEVVTGERVADFLTPENLPETINLHLQNLTFEDDHSLSGQATFATQERLTAIEYRVSEKVGALTGAWQKLSEKTNDYRAEIQNAAYVSIANGWQSFHLPQITASERETGFYMAARGRDHEGRYSELSNIYFCQQTSCREVTTPPARPLQLKRVLRAQTEAGRHYVELVNTSAQNLNLGNFFLSNQEAEAIQLGGELAASNSATIWLEKDWLSADKGEIYLYQNLQTSGDGTMVAQRLEEEFAYQSQTDGRNGWQKNLKTQDWKEIYERE